MTDQPEDNEEREVDKRPRVSRWAVFRSVGGATLPLVFFLSVTAALLAVFHPDTPLPRHWNPTARLSVADLPTPITMWKVRAAMGNPEQCIAALQTGAAAGLRPSRQDSENCHIRTRVSVIQVGGMTTLSPPLMETSCATALRLAMWERHGIQPAARKILGSEVTAIHQIGSYNCRQIRTTQGTSNRWSTHATADAIDITGFNFADGRRIRVINDWNDGTDEGRFLRAARDSACTWFATTLSPEFNSLHADHFHLQAHGWGTCG